jgi:hypothetical protein
MGLLDDIRDGAIRCSSDIDGVLRQCLLLAAKLGHEPFREWVESELNGYPDRASLPDYRIVPATVYYEAYVPGWHMKQTAPPGFFGPELNDDARSVGLRQGVGTLAAMISKEDSIGFMLSGPLYFRLAHIVDENHGSLASARQEVSMASLRGVRSAICNRLVMFVLEIEKSNPDIDHAPLGLKPVDEQIVERAFHLIVEGPSAIVNVSTGAGAIQNVVHQVTPGDIGSLISYFRSLGVPEDNLKTLDTVLAGATTADLEDETSPVSEWIDRATEAGKRAAKTIGKESLVIAFRAFLGQVLDAAGLPPIVF